MAEPSNVLKSVVVWLNHIFKIVGEQLQDVEAKKEVLIALGLNPAGSASSPNLPAGSLASIQQYVNKSDDEIDVEAFVSVVADIVAVGTAIDDFIHVVTDTEDPDLVNDFIDMLLELYLMDAVRLRVSTKDAKIFYGVCKLLNFYQQLSESSGGISNFSGNIGGFLKKVFDSFNAEDDAEAGLVSDTIFVALAALSYFIPGINENLKMVYGYDPSPGSTSPTADHISERTLSISFTRKYEDPQGNELSGTLIGTIAVRPQTEQGGGIEFLLAGGGKFERKFDGWKFSFSMDGVPDVDLKTVVKIEHDAEQFPMVIGDPKGSNLRIGDASFQITGTIVDNNLDFKLTTKDSAFVLAKGKNDGFLDSILPDKGINGAFDLGLGYSLKKGLYVDGGSGLSVFVPLHATLGPLVLNAFYLKVGGNDAKDGVLVETSIGLNTSFLGFSASVDRIGLLHNFSLPASGKKNLGFVNYDINFKPPTGVGLSLNAGVLKGGGFLYFDPGKGEYFGALELSFKDVFTLKAVGVITTKMPDGSPGFSMLIIITAEFPPIQLGFGFTLLGVGGLLGLNRTARIDALRDGIKTNTLNSILFPDDVVGNMSRIISDIRQVFPPEDGHFLVGPMGKIGWGSPTIVSLELGILIEIPVARIAILGILKALLPGEDQPVLRLQVNFLGVIDFDNKYISFDASIYDSRLLTFTLTGDMALRISWGDQKVFILSVGGFHPAFKEAPADLQSMTRLTISLLSGENPRITIQCYFAVTSSTVQFGAKAELYAAAGGFNIYGFIAFDLLFQFDPFKFVADFAAGLALRRGSSVLMGIQVSGELSGTNPWDARGEASISILFFDITVSFHETWGDLLDAVEDLVEDLLPLVAKEIADDRNWKADPPQNHTIQVSVKELKSSDGSTVVHPFGVLSFSQRLLPLEIALDKFGNKKPKDVNQFSITPADSGVTSVPTNEQFAPATFIAMNDSQKLASPSFQQMKSGFSMTGTTALVVPSTETKDVDYELTYLRKHQDLRIPAGKYAYDKSLFVANLRAGAAYISPLSAAATHVSKNAPDAVTTQSDDFVIATTSDMKAYAGGTAAGSYAEIRNRLNQLLDNNPSLKGELQIVAEHELNRN